MAQLLQYAERSFSPAGLMFVKILLLLILIKPGPVTGQRFEKVEDAEKTLASILRSLNLSADDSLRRILNQQFTAVLFEAIKLKSSDNYPFDSLRSLIKITSPDNKFRIYHWNLPSRPGEHHYHGFIKILDADPPMIHPLVDFSDSLTSPDTAVLDNKHWPGALYYKVIPDTTDSGQKIYTLLGWAGKNQMVTCKVIDILWFDNQNEPRFGMKVFPDYPEGNRARVIFRFSATTTMSLKYEKQTVASNKRWNSKKREFEYTIREEPMIVFDRMVPLDQQLVGQYHFYVAAGDVYDGFIFEKNLWKFVSGIELRNNK